MVMKRPVSTQTSYEWLQNRNQSSPSNTRTKLMSMGVLYAPLESYYFTICAAIIDAILELYRGASYNLYSQIVRQWGTPGCQDVFKQLKTALLRHTASRTLLVNMMNNPDSDDWILLESLVCNFVKTYCNRTKDLHAGKPNIYAESEKSKVLTFALSFHSLGEYLKINFDSLNVYRGEAKDIMEQTTHSRLRDKFIQNFKRAGYDLHYGDKIREGAHLWVRVRVLLPPNKTIEGYATDRGITKKALLDRLDPFDRATGYMRQHG